MAPGHVKALPHTSIFKDKSTAQEKQMSSKACLQNNKKKNPLLQDLENDWRKGSNEQHR